MIGVTGAPAAGKSTVTRCLAEAGCSVIDVDGMGHRALDLPEIRDAVAADLGADVLGEDGSLDRAAVGARAFEDPAVVRRLESLVHPVVLRWIDEELARTRQSAVRAVVIDCALLFEGGLDRLCDHTLWVDAPRAERAERARRDRGWTDEELARRESHQLPTADKRARSERVLPNDRGPTELVERTLALLDELVPRQGAHRPTGGARGNRE